MPGEFDLIQQFFAAATAQRADVDLGIGDDCALLRAPPGMQLALSTDTLVCGRHFLADADPCMLGHKALAVNLSDLAAMGAEPAWVTLALTLPEADEPWLASFMQGFAELADAHKVQLVGGDTTRGPLSITVQVHGFVEPGRALTRDGARPGDLIYASGNLGDAGLALLAQQGLYVRQGSLKGLNDRLHRPTPRLALGRALRGIASAAIDLSDGLGSDLGHICQRSGVGAMLHLEHLSMSPAVSDYVAETGDWSLPVSAGDDYELAFCVPPDSQAALLEAWPGADPPITWIGMIEQGRDLRATWPDGRADLLSYGGFDHFGD